jgi:hypothetical protein
MKRFVVACPRGSKTGGPEALHQLVAALSSGDQEAVLWDPYQAQGSVEATNYYSQYGVQWTDSPPVAGDVLVVPEVMGELIPLFYPQCQCIFWWLSVDNFFTADKYPLDVLLKLFPKVIHAAQSHYAQDFLRQQGIEAVMLTDYLNEKFITRYRLASSSSEKATKRFDIAINPAKGLERASKVMTACRDLNFVLLENMSREEVISSLASSKIYLDLGTHPGTDRIPREAAMLDCVIVTNKRGSAGNQIDIAIDEEEFKHSDEEFGFEISVQESLMKHLSSLEVAKSKQENYVNWIAEAESRFNDEVLSLVSKIQNSKYLISDFEKTIADCVDLAYRECDRLSNERDQLVVDRDRLSVERNQLVVNRDQMLIDRDRLSGERDELVISRDRLSFERDQLVVDRHRLSGERDELVVERDELVAERDRLRAEHDQMFDEHNKLTGELTAIKSSIIWKSTYPIQVLGQFVKKFFRRTR